MPFSARWKSDCQTPPPDFKEAEVTVSVSGAPWMIPTVVWQKDRPRRRNTLNGDYLTVFLFPAEAARDDGFIQQIIYHPWLMVYSEKALGETLNP